MRGEVIALAIHLTCMHLSEVGLIRQLCCNMVRMLLVSNISIKSHHLAHIIRCASDVLARLTHQVWLKQVQQQLWSEPGHRAVFAPTAASLL